MSYLSLFVLLSPTVITGQVVGNEEDEYLREAESTKLQQLIGQLHLIYLT